MAVAHRSRGGKVNEDLLEILEKIESIHLRIDGVSAIFELENQEIGAMMFVEEAAAAAENRKPSLKPAEIAIAKFDKYYASICENLEFATLTGLEFNRPMENCGCLFELLSGDRDKDPGEYVFRARSELWNLAIVLKQLYLNKANEGSPEQESAESEGTQQQPPKPKCKYPRLGELYAEMKNAAGTNHERVTKNVVALAYLDQPHMRTLPNKDKPTQEELFNWIKNNGKQYWTDPKTLK